MIRNTRTVGFKAFSDAKYGSLVALEAMKNIPFEVKRVYYIFGVPENEERGFHSHNKLEQILVCVSGSVEIVVSTPGEEEAVLLDDPEKGLYIGPMVWRIMRNFSKDAVLLVLASEHYDEADYIRDKDMYDVKAREYFGAP